MPNQLVILSGPPNAGKSATAEALCQRYDRMLHIDVAVLRQFLRMGRLRPWDDSPAGRSQHELFITSACDMAKRFLIAGYGVVVDDVVCQDELQIYREALVGSQSALHFVVLLPKLDLLLAREGKRVSGRLEALHQRFSDWRDIATIDPEDLAPELVADRVMALASEGRALISGATPV